MLKVRSLDLREMATIIEMMDDIDGVKAGEMRYDGHGNPEPLPSPAQRAESLFSALDKDNDGCLTKTEFVTGYTKRSHILRKQDADDQRRKLNCLILYGSVLNNRPEESDSCATFLASLLAARTGVSVTGEDLEFSEVKRINEERRSAFLRRAFIICYFCTQLFHNHHHYHNGNQSVARHRYNFQQFRIDHLA